MDLDFVVENLKNTNLSEVMRETKVSRQTLYNVLQNKNTTKETVTKLVDYFYKKNNAEVYQNLKFYGAPLFENAKKTYSLEQTLFYALNLSRNDGLVESVLPYVLYKNRSVVNLKFLYRKCMKEDLDNLLGYYLEVSTKFRSNKNFEKFLKYMKELCDHQTLQPVPLGKRKVPEYARSAYTQNEVALSWGLLVRGELNHHLERFEKWAALEKQKSKKSFPK